MTTKKTEETTKASNEGEPCHPSRSLEPRARGYGIGGAYERPYRDARKTASEQVESYGPLPHSGYYGAGVAGSARFQRGQAGYNKELSWYGPQYGETTSGKREDS